MSDGYDRIAQALHGAIGNETRNQLVRVTGVMLPNGNVPCYSEALGNVNVICRTSEDIRPGAWIYIYKLGPEKHSPWNYAGFAAGPDRATRPDISAETVIHVPAPNDGGPSASSAAPPAGSLQATLDAFARQLRLIKGTSTWDEAVDTNLAHLITWREPVTTGADLPTVGNRIGDMRYVILTNTIYVWTSTGWRSPDLGAAGSSAGLALMTAGPQGISSYTLVARTEAGIVPADATISAHAGAIAGVTLEAAGSGQQAMVQLSGPLKIPSRVFSPPSGPVFVGIGGAIATSVSPFARFMQHIGIVIGPSEVLLQIATGTTVMID